VPPRLNFQLVGSPHPWRRVERTKILSTCGQRGWPVVCAFQCGRFPDHFFECGVDPYNAAGCSVRNIGIKTSRLLARGFSALSDRGVVRRQRIFLDSVKPSGKLLRLGQAWSLFLGSIPLLVLKLHVRVYSVRRIVNSSSLLATFPGPYET